MICINSNEKLILQHLSEAFAKEDIQAPYFYSESENAVWLEVETWLEKMKKKLPEEDLTYYYIICGPYDLYEIYANLKMIYQLVKSSVTRSFTLNIVFSYTDADIQQTNPMTDLGYHLYSLLNGLHQKKNSKFRFDINFNFAYNVFGMYRHSDTDSKNRIQQFINLNNQAENIYLTIQPEERVTGTEVEYLCSYLLGLRKKAVKTYPVPQRNVIPMPEPVTLDKLVSAINKGTYTLDSNVMSPEQYAMRSAFFAEWLSVDPELDFIAQILRYIK